MENPAVSLKSGTDSGVDVGVGVGGAGTSNPKMAVGEGADVEVVPAGELVVVGEVCEEVAGFVDITGD